MYMCFFVCVIIIMYVAYVLVHSLLSLCVFRVRQYWLVLFGMLHVHMLHDDNPIDRQHKAVLKH